VVTNPDNQLQLEHSYIRRPANNAKALHINMKLQTHENYSNHTSHRVMLRPEGLDVNLIQHSY
jgi:hypothetical protein